jgi:hypothetical protein
MKTARHAFLTEPSPGVYLLNVQVGDVFEQMQITFSHLCLLVADGARMAYMRGVAK